jgi:hypothetical protein
MSVKNVLDELLESVPELAQKHLGGFIEDALSASREFLQEIEGMLDGWLNQFKRGEINQVELERLMKGLDSYVKIHALTEVGISRIKVQRFFEDVLELLIKLTIAAIV